MPNTTLAQALQHAQQQGLDRIEAQLLLLHVLGRNPHDRAWLLSHDSDPLPQQAAAHWDAAVQRRLRNEPVAYITGWQEFWGLALQVDRRVLVPRPDTETLVQWALDVLPTASSATPLRVIDLGTGSGAVALALQHSRPDVQVHAVDYSSDALTVATANGQRLGLPVVWQHGSWLNNTEGRFAAIVSNPPYIPTQDPHLAALTHEPLSALASGDDGLADIRTIIQQAPAHLEPGGWLLLEHGYDQAEAVRRLLTDAGFSAVQSRQDLAGIERCSGGTM